MGSIPACLSFSSAGTSGPTFDIASAMFPRMDGAYAPSTSSTFCLFMAALVDTDTTSRAPENIAARAFSGILPSSAAYISFAVLNPTPPLTRVSTNVLPKLPWSVSSAPAPLVMADTPRFLTWSGVSFSSCAIFRIFSAPTISSMILFEISPVAPRPNPRPNASETSPSLSLAWNADIVPFTSPPANTGATEAGTPATASPAYRFDDTALIPVAARTSAI